MIALIILATLAMFGSGVFMMWIIKDDGESMMEELLWVGMIVLFVVGTACSVGVCIQLPKPTETYKQGRTDAYRELGKSAESKGHAMYVETDSKQVIRWLTTCGYRTAPASKPPVESVPVEASVPELTEDRLPDPEPYYSK